MFNETETATLIKYYAIKTTEAELQQELTDSHTECLQDRTASGLAHYFSGLTAKEVEPYFKRMFNHYSPNSIYITDKAYYAVYHV